MELTTEHYRRAEVAYSAYCKQTGGKSLATGDTLPPFADLRQPIKDAWAASAIALSLDADMAVMRRREHIDVVFDGPPSNEAGRFVEVENQHGISVACGEWVDRKDGYWALRITGRQLLCATDVEPPDTAGWEGGFAENH